MHACCCRKSPHNLPAAKCAISIIAQGLDGDIWPEHPSSLLPPSNESRQPPDFWKIRFFWLIIVIFYFFCSLSKDTMQVMKAVKVEKEKKRKREKR